VGPERRGELMAGAQAVWVPTIYCEPFGNVAVEAQLCGTPVITTDWGAMTETVEDGVTGFRCRTLGEFLDAARNVHRLSPAYIRGRAEALYSTQAVARRYQRHFERLYSLWSDGWYDVPAHGDQA
jgi:glycosyltransferase involved in cell wall biosynthesis